MAAFGQKLEASGWLRTAPRVQVVYPRIDAGARTSAGDVVWVAWWLTDWVFVPTTVPQQAQLLHSTWLMPGVGGYVKEWPLLRHTVADQGQVVWNNWFFNTKYTPVGKFAFNAARTIYTYTGQAANLGALHRYSLVLSPGGYTYLLGNSFADFAASPGTIPYNEAGQNISFVGRHITIGLGQGLYTYSGSTFTRLRYLKGKLPGSILTTSVRPVFGPKRVSEELGVPFDFSNKTLSGDVLSAPTVTVSVSRGVDPTPQNLWQGSTLISGTTVYATLKDGVAGVLYQVEVTVTASVSGILSLMGYLLVLPDSL